MNALRIFLAAQGYAELGMFAEAHRELDALQKTHGHGLEILECRLCIYMGEKRWHEALLTTGEIRLICPHASSSYIHGAYCLHELKQTDEAKKLLLAGPASLKANPLYYYNLACYEATLGNLDAAKDYLKTSFQMDGTLEKIAFSDPDLSGLRKPST